MYFQPLYPLFKKILHPLLITGIFIVRFLAIHPCQDGNSRISRTLTTLLLLKHGYIHVPYASLERIIEDNKDLYYKILRATQTSFKQDDTDWQPWLSFFLKSLLRQAEFLKNKLVNEDENLLTQLSPNAVLVLNLFDNHSRRTVREIAGITSTSISRNTTKDTLTKLLSINKINRYGKGRKVYYTH